MLTRQAVWVPLVKHNPAFVDSFHRFLHNNPITTLSATAIGLKPEEGYVALVPDARHPDKQIASMLAFSARVLPAACDMPLLPMNQPDCSASQQQQQQGRFMSFGFATAVCDSCNSFHVMERLLPHFNAHVSVNIQSQCLRNLSEGESFLVVSTIDKMGKRLVYCKTEFFAEDPAVVPPADVVEREKNLKTIADLRVALQHYEKVVTGTHVKSILPEGKGK